jgi:WhiB family redox-sensing transcriptional regulator
MASQDNTIKIPDFSEFGNPPCSEVDPELFFPLDTGEEIPRIKNGKTTYAITSRYVNETGAKSICFKCPYKAACLEYAVNDYTLQGIWGGTNEAQRSTIRRQKRQIKKEQMR